MTPGERLVWAAAFERGIFEGLKPQHAAVNARVVVERMRDIPANENIDSSTRAMLDEMRGFNRVASHRESTISHELMNKLLEMLCRA